MGLDTARLGKNASTKKFCKSKGNLWDEDKEGNETQQKGPHSARSKPKKGPQGLYYSKEIGENRKRGRE